MIADRKPIEIIGAPIDLGQNRRGVDMGPSAIRVADLEPALELTSYVAAVKPAAAGDSVGYGRRFVADRPTQVATVPIGYGDGVRRGLSNDAEVLVGGRRRRVLGTISMDNITIDLGPETDVRPGSEAVLIGAQGSDRILAEELARTLETINYEVTCGISARVPRSHHS